MKYGFGHVQHGFGHAALPATEAPLDEMVLGIEALRRENEKFLDAEVAKWNALAPQEKPFEWKGKSAAEILAWRNARVGQVLGLHDNLPACPPAASSAQPSQEDCAAMAPCRPPPHCACLAHPFRETPGPLNETQARPPPQNTGATQAHMSVVNHPKTSYEEKLARWKRAILEEKIIDLDDAAFEEKFAEWDTHALRLEAIKEEILRLEKTAVELKIAELREQAAKQQAELKKAAL